MANIKSQKKRNLTNAKAAERNKSVRSELKSRVKTAVAVGDDDDDASASPSRSSTRLRRRASSTRTRRPAARAAS